MADGLLAYYPDPDGTLEEITIPGWSWYEDYCVPSGEDERGLTGRVVSERAQMIQWLRARLVFDVRSDTGQILHNNLRTFLSHAGRGASDGLFLAAKNKASAWAGFLAAGPGSADVTVVYPSNLYAWLAGYPAEGDRVRIVGLGPDGMEEINRIDTISGDLITLETPTRFDFSGQEPILLCRHDTHPGLYLPQFSESLLTLENNGFVARLDLLAQVHPYALRAQQPVIEAFSGTTSPGGFSFQSALYEWRGGAL